MAAIKNIIVVPHRAKAANSSQPAKPEQTALVRDTGRSSLARLLERRHNLLITNRDTRIDLNQ